jgi:hypothetical protein
VTSPTITFPSADSFYRGVEAASTRAAYLQGLAFIDDYTNIWDEGRITPRLFEGGLPNLPAFRETADRAGPLGPNLEASAATSSKLERTGQGHYRFGDLARETQLRISIRDRLLDLFECTRQSRVSREAYNPGALTLAATSRDVLRMQYCGFPNAIIRETLEISPTELEAASAASPGRTLHLLDLPRYEPGLTGYSHTNSKGITYYLHSTEVTLRGGKPQAIYFFAKVEKNVKGRPVHLPEDRVVKENPRNGFLTVSKKK